MNLKDLIKTNIQANLGDTMKMVKISANKTGEQVSSSLNAILDAIKKLKVKAKKLHEGVESIDLLANAEINASEAPLLVSLQKQFTILTDIKDNINSCEKFLLKLKAFNPKLSAKANHEVMALKESLQKDYDEGREKLFKLSEKKCPKKLNAKENPLLKDILKYIKEEVTKFNENYKCNVTIDKSLYMADILPGSERIRFARYILLKDIPYFINKKKDLYIVFATIWPRPEELVDKESMKKAYERMKLSLTVVSDLVRPSIFSDVRLIDSLTDAKMYLEDFFSEADTQLFEIAFKGSDESRITKHQEGTFRVLDKDNVKVKTRGNNVVITIPKSVYRRLNIDGRMEPRLEVNLLADMEIYCGFGKNKSKGRIKLRTPKPAINHDGSIEVVYSLKHIDKDKIKRDAIKDEDKMPVWNDNDIDDLIRQLENN